jgi:hypothetical protein
MSRLAAEMTRICGSDDLLANFFFDGLWTETEFSIASTPHVKNPMFTHHA